SSHSFEWHVDDAERLGIDRSHCASPVACLAPAAAPLSRAKSAFVGDPRSFGSGPRVVTFLLLTDGFPVWRFLIIEPDRLRFGLPREGIETAFRHYQAER